MMNEKNGSIVKVYWLIDPSWVIQNEMFFSKEGNPNTFSATNHMSHEQMNNPRSLVIWFELIQKVTRKGFEHAVANNFLS